MDTTITVDLQYANGRPATVGHNWHIHRDPVTGACSTAGPHYNPFMAPVSEVRYGQLCSRSNPLYCELGDLSMKHGQYNIGGGRQTYTDVNVPLSGPFSGMKRICKSLFVCLFVCLFICLSQSVSTCMHGFVQLVVCEHTPNIIRVLVE